MNDFARALRLFPCFPCVLVTVEQNIITIGLVHIFSFNPPFLGIGIAPSRHSFGLLKRSREFVVNIPTREILPAVSYCGEHSGRNEDKFKATGLTAETPVKIKTPSISECPVKFECTVVQEVETGDHTWFIGEVVHVGMNENYKKEDAVLYWGGFYRLPGPVIGQR